MARIRTIKPEFWTDERIGESSVTARLLLIGALNFADDYGGLERSSKQLKAQVFPYDAIDCEPLVLELIGAGLFIEYQVGDRKYLHIKGFRKHQKVENPAKPRIPLYDESKNDPPSIGDASPSPHLEVAVSSLEGTGMEGKGRESTSAPKTVPTRSVKLVSRETDPEWFLQFKLAYPERGGGDYNWRGAQMAANARIREGHTPAEFIAGAQRYCEYCRATGKLNTDFVKQASTFLGTSKPFLNPYTLPDSKADTRLRGNLSAADEFMRRTEPAA